MRNELPTSVTSRPDLGVFHFPKLLSDNYVNPIDHSKIDTAHLRVGGYVANVNCPKHRTMIRMLPSQQFSLLSFPLPQHLTNVSWLAGHGDNSTVAPSFPCAERSNSPAQKTGDM